jgi:ketosteroid isomerase-like protein
MSQENIDVYIRGLEAYERRDVEALLDTVDAEVEWHSAILVPLGGEGTVYRGHEGVRMLLRDLDQGLAEMKVEISEIRDLGDRALATGRIRARGKRSGARTESPFAQVVHFKNGKAIRIRAYLDPEEALEAEGLRE